MVLRSAELFERIWAANEATDIREGSDGNFLVVLTDVDPTTGAPVVPGGGGALGIFNRRH